MTDSALVRRFATRSIDDADRSSEEADLTEDLGCFGWLRGVRERAVMLELRKRNGNILAVGYGWLERVEFDPSIGIALHGAGRVIRIRGRHLNSEIRPGVRLFEGVARHRVPWVCESQRRAEPAGATPPIIEVELIET